MSKFGMNEKEQTNKFEHWNVGIVFWFEQHST